MNKKILVFLFIATVCSFTGILSHQASADTFNQNNIIDNSVFDNANAMSASQIDTFLNSFPYSCISPNSGFKAIDPTGYNPTNGYSYGGFVTAGQVIYDSAQAYGINPQVLLVTLQKEQSLVIGGANYCNNGENHKYAAAVGYGCPDSGTTYNYNNINLYQRNGVTATNTGTTCVNSASKAGFSQQVIRAAWLLKFGEQRSQGNVGWAVIKGSWDNSDDPQTCYGGPMTQGTYQRCPSGGSSYYDGYTTIDGAAVHMDNGPTAALYWYTPHFHGNQNFFSLFTSWFGSTVNGSPIYQDTGTSQLFLVVAGTRYYIPTFDVMVAWSLQHFNPTFVPDSYITSLQNGGTLSNIVKMSDDPNSPLFLLDDGKRYPIPYEACAYDLQGQPKTTTWGIDCFNSNLVGSYPSFVMNRLTVQDIALPQMIAFNGAVWKLEGGKKRRIVDPFVIDVLGGWGNIRWMKDLNAQQPLGKILMRNGWTVRFSNSAQVYLFDNDALNPIATPDNLVGWGLQNKINDVPSAYNATDPLPTNPSNVVGRMAKDASGNFYLVEQGYKMPLGNDTAQWPTSTYTYAPETLRSMQTIPLSSIYLSNTSGQIFTVYGSKRYAFPTMDDFFQLGANPNLIRRLDGSIENLAGLTYGGMHMASGRLYKIDNNPNQIYMVNGSTSLYVNAINYPGLPYGKLIIVDPVSAARYPVTGTYHP